ncbi:MAG: hypothetical protein ACI39U_09540 [Candidatus Cryptobacteroides sp.]
MNKGFIVAASMMAVVSVLSCTKVFPKDEDPEIPITGDDESVAMSYADFFRYTTQLDNGNYDGYILTLVSDGIQIYDDTYEGEGTVVVFDLTLNHTDTPTIPSGTYSEGEEHMTFYPGYINDDEAQPSYILMLGKDDVKCVLIEEGSLSVSYSGNTCKIKADVSGDDGTEYSFSFSGSLAAVDVTVPLSDYIYGFVEYYGKDGWDVDGDYNEFTMYLSYEPLTEENFQTADLIQLDFLTSSDALTEIPVGTYRFLEDIDDGSQYVANRMVPGFEDDGYCYASWLFVGSDYAIIYDGTVEITSVENGVYSLDVDCLDEYEREVVAQITTEQLELIDMSETTMSLMNRSRSNARKLSGKPFGVRRQIPHR